MSREQFDLNRVSLIGNELHIDGDLVAVISADAQAVNHDSMRRLFDSDAFARLALKQKQKLWDELKDC